MLTLFSVPKSFSGHIGLIQRNAIKSWLCLPCEKEIILFGNEEGTQQIATEFGLTYIPDVNTNQQGTPLLDGIFKKAQGQAKYDILAYINADIILMSDFLEGVKRCLGSFDKFLIVGQRWNLDIKEYIDFKNPEWEECLRKRVKKEGKLEGPSGIDYFVFPRGAFGEIPPFAVGRTLWDNWLLWKAAMLGIPIIDATGVITIIHQNHPYFSPQGKKGIWKGEEARENQRLAGGISHAFTIRDCSKVLTRDGLKSPKISFYRIFSFPFRYYYKTKILKPLLFPGWLGMLLWRKIRTWQI